MTGAILSPFPFAAVCIAAVFVPSLPSQTGAPEPPPANEAVTLAYEPADASIHEITETFSSVTTEGETTVTDVWERVSRLLVTCTDDGYTNSVTIKSQTISRNGNVVPSPMHTALAGLDLTHTLGKDGTLTSVTGYDLLPGKMAEAFAAPFASTMSDLLNVEALRQRDEETYRQIYAGILGEEMAVGVAMPMAESRLLPEEGQVILYAVSTLTRDGSGDDAVVKVTRRLNSNSTALATEFDGIAAATLNAKGTEAKLSTMIPDDLAAVSVTGTDETVIDLDGLLIGKRTFSLTFNLTPKVSAGQTAKDVRVTQTLTFTATRVEDLPPSGTPEG